MDEEDIYVHVCSEFLDGDQLMIFFIEVGFYSFDDHSTIAIALAGNQGNVLWIDNYAVHFLHHDLKISLLLGIQYPYFIHTASMEYRYGIIRKWRGLEEGNIVQL